MAATLHLVPNGPHLRVSDEVLLGGVLFSLNEALAGAALSSPMRRAFESVKSMLDRRDLQPVSAQSGSGGALDEYEAAEAISRFLHEIASRMPVESSERGLALRGAKRWGDMARCKP
jgi:hypothetical protein